MLAVVKCGGGMPVAPLCADVAALVRAGESVCLVHGASADIDRLALRMGVPQRRLTTPDGVTSRYTDTDTLEVVILAHAGARKPHLMATLAAHQVAALGLTGLDAGMLRARRQRALRAEVDGRHLVVRDNHAGQVYAVNAELLRSLLRLGTVPVLSPPALADDGTPVNVNADRVAAHVAAALGADTLILLTSVPGVLAADAGQEPFAVPLATCAVPADGAPPGYARHGMAVKLIAARDALRGRVPKVRISSGLTDRPLRRALSGAGTAVVLAETPAVAS